jgi:hypothetical protein
MGCEGVQLIQHPHNSQVAGSCDHGNGTSRYIKGQKFHHQLIEPLSTAQDGLCSIKYLDPCKDYVTTVCN